MLCVYCCKLAHAPLNWIPVLPCALLFPELWAPLALSSRGQTSCGMPPLNGSSKPPLAARQFHLAQAVVCHFQFRWGRRLSPAGSRHYGILAAPPVKKKAKRVFPIISTWEAILAMPVHWPISHTGVHPRICVCHHWSGSQVSEWADRSRRRTNVEQWAGNKYNTGLWREEHKVIMTEMDQQSATCR